MLLIKMCIYWKVWAESRTHWTHFKKMRFYRFSRSHSHHSCSVQQAPGEYITHQTSSTCLQKKKKAVFLDERRRYVNVFSCVNIVHVTCLGLSAERKKKIYQKLSGCPNFSDEKQKSLLASFLSRHLSYSQQERYNIIHQQNVGEGLCVWTLLTSLSGTWEKNKVLENIICKNDPN